MTSIKGFYNDRLRPITSSVPTARGASQEERDQASLRVASHALSWADCLELLDALGLDPDRILELARDQHGGGGEETAPQHQSSTVQVMRGDEG